MTTYCRLCAESKSEDEINTTISDVKLKIEEKLVVCCQWNNYIKNTHLPESVCYACNEKLEKSWLFCESVAYAQIKLQEIYTETELVGIKCEIGEDDEFALFERAEDIFVEPIILPESVANDDEKSLIGSTVEPFDENTSRQNHKCDVCHKSFTTAYNLMVRIGFFLSPKMSLHLRISVHFCRFIREFIQMSVLIAV